MQRDVRIYTFYWGVLNNAIGQVSTLITMYMGVKPKYSSAVSMAFSDSFFHMFWLQRAPTDALEILQKTVNTAVINGRKYFVTVILPRTRQPSRRLD